MDRRKYPFPILAVSGLLIKDNKILLVKRKCPPSIGRWSLPGGVVEKGEKLKDAIKREFLEETSLSVEVIKLLTVYEKIDLQEDKIGYHYVILLFLLSLTGGSLKANDDAREACFFSKNEILKLPLTDGLIEVLKNILEKI
ncbi:8-oxo-dGTP diphosphatase [Thermodesulfobium acidiphilum]|uniref:8-oxo-dGTP diphosphatase n=1 Tax=Thermodesulfobium acidiphilum TaxID=1794699 RepID=A0A2R4W196_THEAF|nr:NUDIX hydrolase [Thermodesulfobium acidiphilum]AWB10555.1 8-oxo-dGTP diphosphatase [Thermodesulfobium acidiphilum]PMP86940.1 MAG: DNA mismatch repair protein MutT [Thermodesulfobium narugense]